MLEDCVDICVAEGKRKGFFPKEVSCAGGGKIDRKKGKHTKTQQLLIYFTV